MAENWQPSSRSSLTHEAKSGEVADSETADSNAACTTIKTEEPSAAAHATSVAATSKEPLAAQSDFPDGGFRAWLTVLGGFFCCLSSYGWLSSIGVFQTYYQLEKLQTYSASDVSWIVAVQVFSLSVLAPVNGKIFDNYGSRALIIIGTFLHVFGLMMVSISNEYYQIFLAQSICSGVGTAALFHGATNSVATWFQKRRGLAIGLVSSGASVGGVIIP